MILVAGDRRRPTSFINEHAETFQLLYRNRRGGLDVLVAGGREGHEELAAGRCAGGTITLTSAPVCGFLTCVMR